MSRYINVDAYKKLIEKEMADCYPTEDEFEDGCKTGLEIAVEVLDEMPSADVVEAVRCENCENKRGENGDIYCNLDGRGIHSDSFCSYGKRKKQNG